MMDFEKNVGAQDKKMRLTVAAVLIFVSMISSLGFLETLMLLVSFLLVVSSNMGFCPAYTLLGKNTSSCSGGGCGKAACSSKKEDDVADAESEAEEK